MRATTVSTVAFLTLTLTLTLAQPQPPSPRPTFANFDELPGFLQDAWLTGPRIVGGPATTFGVVLWAYRVWDDSVGFNRYIFFAEMKPVEEALVVLVGEWTRMNSGLWRYCLVWAFPPWERHVGKCTYRVPGGTL